jgi:hypothetical protein
MYQLPEHKNNLVALKFEVILLPKVVTLGKALNSHGGYKEPKLLTWHGHEILKGLVDIKNASVDLIDQRDNISMKSSTKIINYSNDHFKINFKIV